MEYERLGPYRIGKQIGKGGMGAVFEAVYDQVGEQQGLRVAIKALSPQMAFAEGFRERFEAEIDSLKKLRHEGIVCLYGYGEQDSVLFYSMELVEGTSLEDEIKAGRRFNWRETLQIGIQICRALKHAHDHGVVHRDIKPANLMLTPEGRVKIADFGIARLFGGTQLTTAGGVLGTADYMSPEQADGRPVTEKCDQYSLGGVMYALLAGRPPFHAKTMPEMLQLQRFAEPEPVRSYATETPDQLNRLIAQLLAKDPDDRFPNVMVLSRHMEAMEKALSRPLKANPGQGNDSAVGADPSLSQATSGMADEATRALDTPVVLAPEATSQPLSDDIFDAATLDQPTDAQDIPLEQPTLAEPVSQRSISRFTTVDEDARRLQEQSQSNVWHIGAQLAGLLALLGVIIWGGWQMMRPLTADELFETIMVTIHEQGEDNLRPVADQLEEFQQRFVDDSRNQQLEPYRQQWEFQKFERQARLKARVAGAEAADPIASVYLEAARISADNPEKSLAMLQALVALHDPLGKTKQTGNDDSLSDRAARKNETERWLVLTRQKIVELQDRVQQLALAQLPALHKRLAFASQLQTTQPDQARKMYQAIIRLYSEKPWAHEVVEQARLGLKNMGS